MYEINRKEVNLKHDERMPTQCVFCFTSLMNLTKRNIKQLSDISILIHTTSISNIK